MKIMKNMVLKKKERDEAIQLLAMHPQVYGELLTHQRSGNGVDVDALRDQFPPRQITGKGSQIGFHGNRGSRRRKNIFVALSRGFRFLGNLQAEEVGQRSHGGPTSLLGAPQAAPRGLVACPGALFLGSQAPWVSSVPEKNLFGGFIPFGLHLIFSSEKGQKHGKNRNWHLALS